MRKSKLNKMLGTKKLTRMHETDIEYIAISKKSNFYICTFLVIYLYNRSSKKLLLKMLHRRIPQSFLSFFDGLLCSRVIQLLSALPGAFYAKSSRHQLCKHLISPSISPPPTEQPPIYSICRRRYRVVDIIFKSKNIKEIYLILNCLCFLVKSLSAQTHCFLPFTDCHCHTTSLDKDFLSLSTFCVSEVNLLKSLAGTFPKKNPICYSKASLGLRLYYFF